MLIGTGARVSEAIALRIDDVDLDAGTVKIHKQRVRGESLATRPTKGRNFRTVAIGPGLVTRCCDMLAVRAEHGIDDGGWLFLCPRAKRGRYAGRAEPRPPHRKTVHDWHEQALEDAGLADLPLHGLRHTAAAAWLGHGPLAGVRARATRPQLGQGDQRLLRAPRAAVPRRRASPTPRRGSGESVIAARIVNGVSDDRGRHARGVTATAHGAPCATLRTVEPASRRPSGP